MKYLRARWARSYAQTFWTGLGTSQDAIRCNLGQCSLVLSEFIRTSSEGEKYEAYVVLLEDGKIVWTPNVDRAGGVALYEVVDA